MKSILLGIAIAALLSACSTTITPGGTTVAVITPEVKNAIAICSAGIASGTDGSVEAAILDNGGKITIGLGDKLEGMFMARKNLSSADAVLAQKAYMDCLGKYAPIPKTSALESCQSKLMCEVDTLEMLCGCRTTLAKIGKESNMSKSEIATETSKKCYSGQFDLKRCWNGIDPTLPRAECTVSLQNAGKALPTPKAASCLVSAA